MVRWLLSVLLLAVATASFTACAPRQWIHVQSKNFDLHTDLSAGTAEATARELELNP